MSTNECHISILCTLIGTKDYSERGIVTSANWVKYEGANGNSVYKNRVVWNVYDNKSKSELPQFANIICFGKRFDWIAENIDKSQVFITGTQIISAYLNKNEGTPQSSIDITVSSLELTRNAKSNTNTPVSSPTVREQVAQPVIAVQEQSNTEKSNIQEEDFPF